MKKTYYLVKNKKKKDTLNVSTFAKSEKKEILSASVYQKENTVCLSERIKTN